jgi:hypothetical protein
MRNIPEERRPRFYISCTAARLDIFIGIVREKHTFYQIYRRLGEFYSC